MQLARKIFYGRQKPRRRAIDGIADHRVTAMFYGFSWSQPGRFANVSMSRETDSK
jgi:hypothetical protein